MTEYQQKIVKLLAMGMTQNQVSSYLKSKEITPNSLRTIEDHIKRIKKQYKAKTSFHLAVILTKEGLI